MVGVGACVMIWSAVLTGPEPRSVCGRDPNIIVVYGASEQPSPGAEESCRRTAMAELLKGVVATAFLMIGGGALTLVGISRRQVERRRLRSEQAAADGYGRRSEDGNRWWDGYSWRRIEPGEEPPPPLNDGSSTPSRGLVVGAARNLHRDATRRACDNGRRRISASSARVPPSPPSRSAGLWLRPRPGVRGRRAVLERPRVLGRSGGGSGHEQNADSGRCQGPPRSDALAGVAAL